MSAPAMTPEMRAAWARDRLWCMCLLDEGAEVIQRVTGRFIAHRDALLAAPEPGWTGVDWDAAALKEAQKRTAPERKADVTDATLGSLLRQFEVHHGLHAGCCLSQFRGWLAGQNGAESEPEGARYACRSCDFVTNYAIPANVHHDETGHHMRWTGRRATPEEIKRDMTDEIPAPTPPPAEQGERDAVDAELVRLVESYGQRQYDIGWGSGSGKDYTRSSDRYALPGDIHARVRELVAQGREQERMEWQQVVDDIHAQYAKLLSRRAPKGESE